MKKRASLLFCLTVAVLLFHTTCRSPTPLPPWPVAGIGDTVEVRFEVTEALAANPEVRLGEREMLLQSFNSGIYTYAYIVDGTEADGRQAIEIDTVDLAGNEGSTEQLDSVGFDFSKGRGEEFASRALVDGVITDLQVAPSLAGVGADVGATFRITIPCLPYPAVEIGGNPMAFSSLSGGIYTYTYQVTGSEGNGFKDVEVQVQTTTGDTDVELLADAVWLDVTAPAVLNLGASPSIAAQGTLVTLTFRTTEPCYSLPSVRLGEGIMTFISLSGGIYTYAYSVLGTEEEGTKDLDISLEDAAGNPGSGSQLDAVFFDFTPVAISDFAASPLHVSSGIQVAATFRINEPCVGSPSVSLAGSSMAFASLSGGRFTYTYFVTGAEAEGSKSIEIAAEDLAGNASIQQQPDAVWFDFTAPAAIVLEVLVR